jgi:hypothetical protein
MARGKTLTESAHIGDAGIALIHTIVNRMGHKWGEGAGSKDVGIDGSIELRNPATGEMSGRHIYVQSKAARNPFPGEDEDSFHYLCDERDLTYWLAHPEPVIVICSHPDEGCAWWVHIQGYFADPARAGTRRIDFDKTANAFTADVADTLLEVADPYGAAHTPVALAKHERLITNLLPVDLPPQYWRAPTHMSSREIRDRQRRSDYPERQDWVLSNKHIYSFAAFSGTSLARVPDVAANAYPTVELADGSGNERRLLVELLNRTLREDLAARCSFHFGRKFLYVKAPDDLGKTSMRSTTGRSRQIFQAYPMASDPSRIAYCRHAALRWQFLAIDGQWFAAITPDYYFSSDGYQEAPNAKKYLTKIKQIDRHLAVLGETRVWVAMLRESEGTLTEDSRILHFGEPLQLDIGTGIDDAAWAAPKDAPDELDVHGDLGDADDALPDDGQGSLFDDEEFDEL